MSDSVSPAASADPFTPAVDVHVHLMPDRLMAAIRKALSRDTDWTFPHPTDREAVEANLRAAGVERYVALPYAHRPGIARDLNDWVLARAEESSMAVPFATVHGADDVERVVEDAFADGARGLKFQCPVQECSPVDPRLDPAFERAATQDHAILFHAGTAPMFEDSPHVGPDLFEQFLESYPDVRAACAHMGTYDHEAFVGLVREYDNAFLDTSVAMSTAAADDETLAFDPESIPDGVFEELSERIMYGSDYPNIPHEYRDERAGLLGRDLSTETYRDLFERTAERFLGER